MKEEPNRIPFENNEDLYMEIAMWKNMIRESQRHKLIGKELPLTVE